MSVLKHVGVLSVAKITALIGLVFGLIFGICYGILLSAIPPVTTGFHPFRAFGGVALVLLGVVLGVVGGFIHGAIMGFLYNVFAGWIGGVEIDLG
jgi:hypothetical protein